jgi:hypothetical protein
MEDGSEEARPKVEQTFVNGQLQQMNESYRMVITLTVQVMTVFVLGNVTLVGYAISQRIAGILLIGPIFPIGIFLTILITGRAALPIIYAYVNLEQKQGGYQADWLGRTIFSYLFKPKHIQRLLEIGKMPEWPQRLAAIKKMPILLVGTGKGLSRAGLVLIALGQVGAAFVLWGFFDWRMF